MEQDIQRIEVGVLNTPSISENDIKPPDVPFDFSSVEITFDDPGRTFDEN